MNTLQHVTLFLIIATFVGVEIASRRYVTFHSTANDAWLEVFASLTLIFLTQPFVFSTCWKLCELLIPTYRGTLKHLPWWEMTGILLIADDMTHYWWHRLSHTRLLWPLHRAHHSAHYMSIRIIYRNNLLYYLIMPTIWINGTLIYMGMTNVYLVYIVVKLTIIMGAHSSVRWDEYLYRVKWLKPAAWIIERTFSTPATHWAHHALTKNDGIGHYTGNFGNLLFFWDVLFGTAKITRRYPQKVGLPDDLIYGKEKWFVELLYPLFKSRRDCSALRPGGHAYVEARSDNVSDFRQKRS